MHGGAFVAKWLKTQGVTHVFALCGEHVLPLFDGCADEGIEVIGCRHEQGAVLAAEAFARVTGRPGVAAVTAGPGMTNAVTGLAVANTSGSPVMLLAGRTSAIKRHTGMFQDLDGANICAPVTKFTDTVPLTERLGDYLEIAWRKMVGGRPGAVMLQLPHDVLKGATDAEPRRVTFPEPSGASPEALRHALRMIDEAERPILIAGGGAFWSGAGDALRAFAERARIPVTQVNAARGIIPDGEEVSLGPLSEGGLVLAQSDLVILVGTKLDASVTFGGPPLFPGTEKLLQIDIESPNVGFNRYPDLGLVGDARVVMQQLADNWDGKPKDAWLAQAKESGAMIHNAWRDQTAPLEGSPVPPGRVAHEVLEAAGPEAILVSDGGDVHTWNVTRFPAYRPGSLLQTHDALGTIGVGVAYALGAKAAEPQRDVVLSIGDGSFGFGAMELETATRYNLPFTCVVVNNGAWGNIRHEQGKQFGKETGATQLAQAGYEKIAEAFGGFGIRVDDAKDVGPAIRKAIDSRKPAVVNVITQQGVVSPVTEMVGGMMTLL